MRHNNYRLALFSPPPREAEDPERFRQPHSGELYNDWLNAAMFLASSADRIDFDPDALPDYPIREADGTDTLTPGRRAALEAALDAFHAADITPLPVAAPMGFDAKGDRRRRLTAEDVCYIRSSDKTGVVLGLELGVHPNTVNDARRGVRWKDLDCSKLSEPDPLEDLFLEEFDFLGGDIPSSRIWTEG